MEPTIDITWQMHDPPMPAKSWRTWTETDFAELSLKSENFPSSILNRLVEQVLKKALAENLSRSTGWKNDPSLSPELKLAVKAAAEIYKRGVPFSNGTETSVPTVLKGQYPVQIAGSQNEVLKTISSTNFLIVDQNVYRHHGSLFAGRADAFVIQLDEHSKILSSVRKIIDAWNRSKKSSTWCIVGGGILTDTAAFAASLCQCESILLPTTLLAMADACVGGKTGVNVEGFGKNLVGKFYFPKKVLAWTGWLNSLEQRQMNAGAFECLKHFFINNDLPGATAFANMIVKKDIAAIAAVLPSVVTVKAKVVEQDPAETGKRAILNLGHTLGHAIEGVSQKLTTGNDTILHGEAVGVGMMFAMFLSTKISGLPHAAAEERINILKLISFKNNDSSLEGFFAGKNPASDEIIGELRRYITQDKKTLNSSSEQSQWILLASNGEVGGSSTGWTYNLQMVSFPTLWREFLKIYC